MAKRFVVVMILATLLCMSAFAFQFSPLEQTFEPKGQNSYKTYTIVNDSDDSIAIEISALVRNQDADGNEVNTSAANYFDIVPKQVIVKPQSTQVVRVQYKGPSTVTTELSFRLRAEQIPYSQGKQASSQSMFNFLYVYSTSLYVSPSDTVVKVDIGQIVAAYDEEGNEVLKVTVQNKGNVHQILMDASLTVKDGVGNKVVLSSAEQLPGIDSTNILAKKKITKVIPFPEGLVFKEGASYSGEISYTE